MTSHASNHDTPLLTHSIIDHPQVIVRYLTVTRQIRRWHPRENPREKRKRVDAERRPRTRQTGAQLQPKQRYARSFDIHVPPSVFNSIDAYAYLHRNGEKQINGQRAQRAAKPRRRKKRSESWSLRERQRTRGCSQKKRRRAQRKPPQSQRHRRKPESPRAPVPSPLGMRQKLPPPCLQKAPARMAAKLRRSRALLPRALTTHLI
jgi:hypothetical protein